MSELFFANNQVAMAEAMPADTTGSKDSNNSKSGQATSGNQQKKRKKNAPDRPQPAWLFPPDEENPILNPKPITEERARKDKAEWDAAVSALQHKAVTAPTKPPPPGMLLTLIGAFLTSYGFNPASRLFSTHVAARARLDDWKTELGVKLPKGCPDLVKIFKDWHADWEASRSDNDESEYDSDEDSAAAKPRGLGTKTKEGLESSTSGADSSSDDDADSDVSMEEAPKAPNKAKKLAKKGADSSGTSSDSDSDVGSNAGASLAKKAPKSTKLKRKAVSNKPSKSDPNQLPSDSSSDTSSEGEPPTKKAKSKSTKNSSRNVSLPDKVKPKAKSKAKKAPVSTDTSSSESSESSSDSDSDSEVAAKQAPASKKKLLSRKSTTVQGQAASIDSAEKAPGITAEHGGNSAGSSDSSTLAGSPVKDIKHDSSASLTSSSSSSASSSSSVSSPPAPVIQQKKSEAKRKRSKSPNRSLTNTEDPSNHAKKVKTQSTPFQRIPTDTMVDPKLASNAYVPYDYADRAHKDLSVTKGKDFTKEKNKKKRGAYRGGQIDVQGKNGIKFDD